MGVCPFDLSSDSQGKLTCSVDSGYSFHVISAVPTSEQIPKICASSACKRVIAGIKSTQPTECNTGGPSWDFKIYEQIIGPIEAGCRASPPVSPPTVPPVTATPPTAPPLTVPPTAAAPPAATAAPSVATTTAPPAVTAGPPATTAPSSMTTTPSSPTTTAPIGESTDQPSVPPSSGSNGQSTASTPITTNETLMVTPSPDAIASASSTTGPSTIKTTTIEASGGSNSTVIIAVVAGIVVVVALVAFLAFRAGKRKNDSRSSRELTSYAAAPPHHRGISAAVARPATRGAYAPSRDIPAASWSDHRPSAPTADSSMYSSSTGVSAENAVVNVTGAAGVWSDPAILKARIPLEEIVMGDVLSQGAFGEVLRGSYNSEPVAIKRLLPARRKDMKEIESFLDEAKLLTSLRHPRIVLFIGVAWDSLTDLCIVTELMDGGDLRSLLTHADATHEPIGFDAHKVKIALHMIHALTYLHSLKPAVVHRDLKSKNVLLTRELDAKLTDFGVSRERQDKTMTAGVGSSLWMAPEVMLGNRYDQKADVFSFGVVLSELDTQKLPYAHAKEPGTDRKLPEMAMLNMVSAGRLTVAFTDDADPDMVATGRACVAVDPRERPTASEVLHRLHHIYRGYL